MTDRELMQQALEALEANQPVNYCMNTNGEKFPMMQEDPFRFERNSKAITALREALAEQPAQHRAWFTVDELNAWADKKLKENPQWAEQPAQQEPVAKVCHDLDGHIGWNPNLRQLPDEGAALYTSLPTLSLAQRPHECSRSHPHENMNAMCELRTEIARLTNENARLKAMHQNDEINTYRMTLLCIRDGLQQGMSKSIQKLQAREINDVLGLPSFASYRTSPPAQQQEPVAWMHPDGRIWTFGRGFDKSTFTIPLYTSPPASKPLSVEKIAELDCNDHYKFARAIEAAHGIKENT